jgi:3D (Asp-Asp-Asp) domain-containing protein
VKRIIVLVILLSFICIGATDVSANRRKRDPRKPKKCVVIVTAYSSTHQKGRGPSFTTANGYDLSRCRAQDTIAANFLPFDTKIIIPELFGDKVFVVRDRMHRRFPHRLDVWMPTFAAAKKFGKKEVEILIFS